MTIRIADANNLRFQTGRQRGLSGILTGGGGGGLFDFELMDTSGSTAFTSVPNLRIYLSGDVNDPANWYPVGSVPGHTLTLARGADGKSIVISGWTGGVVPAGMRVHYEQRLPEEPNNAYGAEAGLFARRVGDSAPVNPRLPGMSICPTIWNAPVGVT